MMMTRRIINLSIQSRVTKDLGGVEDGAVDTRQLLSQHHHHGNDQRSPQRSIGQHLLQSHLGHQLHALLLLLHHVHLLVNLNSATQPAQSCTIVRNISHSYVSIYSPLFAFISSSLSRSRYLGDSGQNGRVASWRRAGAAVRARSQGQPSSVPRTLLIPRI